VPDGRRLPKWLKDTKAVASPREATRGAFIVPADMHHRWNWQTPGETGELERAIAVAGDLSRSHFGFRKERSTVDAVNRVVEVAGPGNRGHQMKGGSKEYCLMVTQDIRNAFNTARWDRFLEALTSRCQPT